MNDFLLFCAMTAGIFLSAGIGIGLGVFFIDMVFKLAEKIRNL